MKKYMLLKSDYIVYKGRTLYRIKATRSFGRVAKDTLGGYIEYTLNLSQQGDCWVEKGCKVYDESRVYNDAWLGGWVEVYDFARIYGEAFLCGNSKAFGFARVYENSRMFWHSKISGHAHLFGKGALCNYESASGIEMVDYIKKGRLSNVSL